MADDTRTVVNGFFAALAAGRGAEAHAFLAEDVRYDIVAPPPVGGNYDRAGLAAIAGRWMYPMFDEPLEVVIVGMTVEGERAAIEARSSCRLRDGSEYLNRYHFLFMVRDGSIVEAREYLDSGYLAEVLARLWPNGAPQP